MFTVSSARGAGPCPLLQDCNTQHPNDMIHASTLICRRSYNCLHHRRWLASMLPADAWPQPGTREGWDPRWGDRKQSLVLIGQRLDGACCVAWCQKNRMNGPAACLCMHHVLRLFSHHIDVMGRHRRAIWRVVTEAVLAVIEKPKANCSAFLLFITPSASFTSASFTLLSVHAMICICWMLHCAPVAVPSRPSTGSQYHPATFSHLCTSHRHAVLIHLPV